MAGATAAARAERRPGIAVRLGVSVVVGLVSGIFGAYCYHQVGTSPLSLNSLAHSVGLWVFLAFVVSLGLPSSAAAGLSAINLVVSVASYYGARAVLINPYNEAFDGFNVVLWSGCALVGGAVIGLLATASRNPKWLGALATTLVVGMLLGDALIRVRNWGPDLASATDVVLAVAVAAVSVRSLHRLGQVLLLTPGLAAVGYLLSSLPNAIQQVLVVH